MAVIRLLILNDLHSLHTVGLCPPGHVLRDGNEVSLNVGQQYLWKCWNHLKELAAKEIKPDVLIVDGDLVDGEQRRSGGKEAIASLISAQQKAATTALAPFAEMVEEVIVIHGTPYHDGTGGEFIEPIAEHLGAVGDQRGWHARPFVDWSIGSGAGEVVVNVQHGIGVASGFYRATPLDREGVWSALAGKEGKVPKADCVVRAHAHVYVRVEHPTKHIVISPAWQLQTDYMRKNSYYRMLPDLGALVIEIDPSAKRKGEDPISIRKILYPLPQIHPYRSKIKWEG